MYRVGDEVTLVDEVGVYKVLTAEVDGKLIIEVSMDLKGSVLLKKSHSIKKMLLIM